MPLIFSKTLHVTDITLDRPEIALLRDASGKMEFFQPGQQVRASREEASEPRLRPLRTSPSASST